MTRSRRRLAPVQRPTETRTRSSACSCSCWRRRVRPRARPGGARLHSGRTRAAALSCSTSRSTTRPSCPATAAPCACSSSARAGEDGTAITPAIMRRATTAPFATTCSPSGRATAPPPRRGPTSRPSGTRSSRRATACFARRSVTRAGSCRTGGFRQTATTTWGRRGRPAAAGAAPSRQSLAPRRLGLRGASVWTLSGTAARRLPRSSARWRPRSRRR
mmetsp:Transcript_47029/g.152630  ORF Transcript_47029/g.152630 Transcript_47029/m.152630 type:complete len:218 (-) Transcript_47029:101-754(-)